MSITVNYKGEQIAQSAGDNLTLNTAGKYMEADVILQALGGGGSAVAEGEITLDTASETITVTHNLGTQNVAILVEHENPTYGVNGAVGCLFVNKTGIPFSASGFFADGAIHVVYETRTTWASYSAAQVNSTSLQAYFYITDNAVTIPCRNGNYKYQTGTYKYKVFILSAGGGLLPTGISEITTGTYTWDADTNLYANNLIVEHGMSATPKFALLIDEYVLQNGLTHTIESTVTQIFISFGMIAENGDKWGCTYGLNSSNGVAGQNYTGNNVGRYSGIAISDTQLKISGYSGHLVAGGHTYRWIAIR